MASTEEEIALHHASRNRNASLDMISKLVDVGRRNW